MADEQPDDLATRLARLEDDLKASREESAGLKGTLETLQGERRAASGTDQPRRPVGGFRISRQDAEQLAEELGGPWTAAMVQEHAPTFFTMFRFVGRDVLNGVQGMADMVDDLDARTDVPDWKDLKSDVDKMLADHRSRGDFITRKKAAALVKAERMQNPEYVDRLADERVKTRAEEAAKREAEGNAGETEGTKAATQTAGPSPSKRGRTTLDPDEFDKLPVEEQRDYMNKQAIAF